MSEVTGIPLGESKECRLPADRNRRLPRRHAACHRLKFGQWQSYLEIRKRNEVGAEVSELEKHGLARNALVCVDRRLRWTDGLG